MKRFICILTVIMMLLCGVTAHADFGNFAGDSDYGNDSGGYDYDYDYDDYDYGDDDDYDYDGGGFFYLTDGDGDGTGIIYIVAIVALIIGVIFIRKKFKNVKGRMSNAMMNYQNTVNPNLRAMNEYTQLDPEFSESEFKEKVSNMYVQFQNAWENKDMEELRPYLTENLYAQCEQQLEEYKRDHRTNKVDNIAVLEVTPLGWTQQDGNDIISVRLKTRITDYVIDDATGNVISGSKTAEKFMEYEWLLARTSGKTTADFEGTVAHTCPNCGAPIDLNKSAKCEYCETVVESDTFNWAVREIKGISQRTVQTTFISK